MGRLGEGDSQKREETGGAVLVTSPSEETKKVIFKKWSYYYLQTNDMFVVFVIIKITLLDI